MLRLVLPTIMVMALSLISAPSAQAEDITVDLGRGQVHVNVPPSYDADVASPLVVLLHGYTSSGERQEAYMQFTPLSDSRGFIFTAPDGLVDSGGNPYWNATDACCDFDNAGTDDSGYIRALIEEIQSELSIDPKRIFVTGHSNGGFMSYRMACDHADLVAAIAPLAGTTFLDTELCTPSEPVNVLHMHGTGDLTIPYDGGCTGGDTGCFPGAEESLDIWASYNGCSGRFTTQGIVDYDTRRRGPETVKSSQVNGCPEGGTLELWRMNGSRHSPSFTDAWNDAVIDFFFANPKP